LRLHSMFSISLVIFSKLFASFEFVFVDRVATIPFDSEKFKWISIFSAGQSFFLFVQVLGDVFSGLVFVLRTLKIDADCAALPNFCPRGNSNKPN
jgi:hypothetical protein